MAVPSDKEISSKEYDKMDKCGTLKLMLYL